MNRFITKIHLLFLYSTIGFFLAAQGSPSSQSSPGDRDTTEQPRRRSLGQAPTQTPTKQFEQREPQQTNPENPVKPSAPYPPYPNYPESSIPRPPRTPRRALDNQEYLYLNHIYFEPLTMAIGGFISFGWLSLVGSNKALRLGLDLYNPGTNISIVTQGQQDNPKYLLTSLLMRIGLHVFIQPNQLKGLSAGIDLRSGVAVLPSSGNAVVFQAFMEFPITYRFVITFYASSGRPAVNLGLAPYIIFNIGGYLATSNNVNTLIATDSGFFEYVTNGNLFIEPNFVYAVDPIALKFGIRFGFDVSFVF